MTRNNEEVTTAGPVRMCVICRRRFPKKALQRHVVAPEGGLEGDSAQTRPGRGYYVCSDAACAAKFARFRPQGKRTRRKKGTS